MARSRLSRGWLIAAVFVAVVGLVAFGASATWVAALAVAPDTWMFAVLFAGAALASLAIVIGIPVTATWRPPAFARTLLSSTVGLLALVAAGGVWVLFSLVLCTTDGQCRPRDTWLFLPALITCGVLVAAGPGIAARWATEPWSRRLWIGTVVAGLLGVVAALVAWVELVLYPSS